MNTLPALLLAAAGVGVGHAAMPDHWLPLAVLSRTNRYRTGRVVRLSLAAALAHVVVSLALGGILILIGLQFRATVARHTDLVVGGILLVTGAVFLALDLLGKGHGHRHDTNGHPHIHTPPHAHAQGGGRAHDGDGHGHDGHAHYGGRAHEHEPGRSATTVIERPRPAPANRTPRGVAALLIPFGAAASPDLTILPVFLAASALGVPAALGSLATFTVATMAVIVGLTTVAALGARQFTAGWIDRRANLITALTLTTIGALVAAGLI